MKYSVRYPNFAGMMRGNNMIFQWCIECEKNRARGYSFYDENIMKQAIFICDDCLKQAKKEVKD